MIVENQYFLPIDGDGQRKVAYVEVNSHDIADVGCYKENTDALFDIAVIFAANINFDENTQSPVVYLNPQVSDLLNNHLYKIQSLQSQGIKVVLDILGNHQNAGWSCFATQYDANSFADKVKRTIDYYGLDGVDIDDEYSKCTHQPYSLIRVTKALKEKMPDKLISKALYADIQQFSESLNGNKIADNLTYGWEMSYWSNLCTSRLGKYETAGMSRAQLGVGASTILTSARAARELARCAKTNGYGGGMMIFNLKNDSLNYLQSIWKNVSADPSCFVNN